MGCDIHRVGNLLPCACVVVLRLRGEHDAHILIVEYAKIGLRQLQSLGDGLASRNLDEAAVCQRLSVNGQPGSIWIGLVNHHQLVIDILAGLRLVHHTQRIIGGLSGWYVGNGGHININLRHLYLHRCFHDGGTRTIILGLRLTLVRA